MASTADILQALESRGLDEMARASGLRFGAPIGEVCIPLSEPAHRARRALWSDLHRSGMRTTTIAEIFGVTSTEVVRGMLAYRASLLDTQPLPEAT